MVSDSIRVAAHAAIPVLSFAACVENEEFLTCGPKAARNAVRFGGIRGKSWKIMRNSLKFIDLYDFR